MAKIKKEKLIIGTRSSELALWQANFVKKEIEKIHKNILVELKLVKTKGDKILDVALSKIGDKGLFTKELEKELLAGNIDIAVHSLKDMETQNPKGLIIAAVTERHNPQDVLVAKKKKTTIESLPVNAKIATSSLRRASQIKHLRPDVEIVDVRGNVQTRLKKFQESDWDAMLMARAGLERMKLKKHISYYIPVDEMIPACGQGALGIQVAAKNKPAVEAVKPLNHENTLCAVTAERTLLKTLEGGCQIPVGAYAEIKPNGLYLEAIVGSIDGTVTFRKKVRGKKADAAYIGTQLAKELLKAGANKVLKDIRK